MPTSLSNRRKRMNSRVTAKGAFLLLGRLPQEPVLSHLMLFDGTEKAEPPLPTRCDQPDGAGQHAVASLAAGQRHPILQAKPAVTVHAPICINVTTGPLSDAADTDRLIDQLERRLRTEAGAVMEGVFEL